MLLIERMLEGRTSSLVLCALLLASGDVSFGRSLRQRNKGLNRRFLDSPLVTVSDHDDQARPDEGDSLERSPCPFVISESEAEARRENGHLQGNIVDVTSINYGRTGNRILIIMFHLGLGFGCKSKLVTLPPDDQTNEPGMFLASQQWFDFSSAPHFDSIDDVSMDESVCPDVSHGRMDAFQKLDLSEGAKKLAGTVLSDPLMRKDINNCAAMYIGPSVNTSTCGPREDKSGEGTGHLVIHIRSGDVYSEDPHPGYGQPPLEYYIDILGARDWSRVSILAHADDDLFLGPVAKTLKMMVEAGAFPLENIVFHTDRSFLEDLRDALCADALVLSRSTLNTLFQSWSRATTFFSPNPCPRLPFPSTLDVEIYGVNKKEMSEYDVYQTWNNTAEQRAEMLMYSGSNLQKCFEER